MNEEKTMKGNQTMKEGKTMNREKTAKNARTKNRIIYAHYRQEEVQDFLKASGKQRLDILFAGATGVGKSSTLNSLITARVSDVGTGVDPETSAIKKYCLSRSINLWDTPGLGDSAEADARYETEILKLLHVKKSNADGTVSPLIDLVAIIVDGSSREMGTTFKLLTGRLKNLLATRKLLVLINQADCAMHTHRQVFWKNRKVASPELLTFLDEKAGSVMERIRESTGFDVERPLCYSAKYNFNIKKVYDRILDTMMNRQGSPEEYRAGKA